MSSERVRGRRCGIFQKEHPGYGSGKISQISRHPRAGDREMARIDMAKWRNYGQRKHETGLGIFTEKSKAQEGVTLSENKLI